MNIDSRNIMETIDLGVAPRAFLMPISLVRSLTMMSMMLLTPITPAIMENIPTIHMMPLIAFIRLLKP